MNDLGPCRGCGVQMLWVATVNGKMQPLDPEPDPERGNIIVAACDVEIDGRRCTRLGLSIQNLNEKARAAAKEQGVRLYTPHHMTCPKNRRGEFNRGRED